MTYKYLYIDDETESSLESYRMALQGNGALVTVTTEEPVEFDTMIPSLIAKLPEFHGLILDWRLDEKTRPDKRNVAYRAAALAHEIRTRGAGGETKELAIVLLSTRAKLQGSYSGDSTSHELFDWQYDKGEIVDDNDKIRHQLASLARGYTVIHEKKATGLGKIMGLDSDQIASLDPRFTERFAVASGSSQLSDHDYARFILKETVLKSGLLIDELTLAARLGVDLEKSPDWRQLRDELSSLAGYSGPFSDAWPRWWAATIEKGWWRAKTEESKPQLSTLTAQQRVAYIKEITGIQGLEPVIAIKPEYETRFQTICAYHNKPLDPNDGVLIDDGEPLPWQDRRYISIDAALERRNDNIGLRLHPMERERVASLRRSRS